MDCNKGLVVEWALLTYDNTLVSGERKGGQCPPPNSRHQFLNHPSRFNTRQSLVEPLVTIREAFVVEPEQRQDRRVEVVNGDGVFDDVVGEIVGLAVDLAGS